MDKEDAVGHLIVLSRSEYGAFRATPPNLIVRRGNPPTEQAIVFRNISESDVTITLIAPWPAPSLLVPACREREVAVPTSLPDGQYFYKGTVGPGQGIGRDTFEVQGSSGPGIIVTP
jgi:hypothetical protein